jgi:uncharacterized repeat protein (TIGR01451 family)
MVSARPFAVFVAAVWLCAPLAARAVGTQAGTSIQNTAQASYTVGGSTTTVSSNTSAVIVAEILDVVTTVANPTVPVSPGATQQELVFTITNTGNGTETFGLVALSAGMSGDDFDPDLASPAIYFDSDDSGDFSAADLAYVAGTNDPVLAADAGVRVVLVNSIPSGVVSGNRGRSELRASAMTGSGTPGTAFIGLGDGNVDAMAGATGAAATLSGEYVVTGLQLTAVKSQAISDRSGGQRASPGARIDYQIVVTAIGSGTASAAVFSDLIPANTTYVTGSLQLNSVTLSDSADADAGEFTNSPAPEVRVNLGDLTSASAAQTIGFAVTIN